MQIIVGVFSYMFRFNIFITVDNNKCLCFDLEYQNTRIDLCENCEAFVSVFMSS